MLRLGAADVVADDHRPGVAAVLEAVILLDATAAAIVEMAVVGGGENRRRKNGGGQGGDGELLHGSSPWATPLLALRRKWTPAVAGLSRPTG